MKVCDIVQFYSPLSGGVKRYIKDKIRFFASSAPSVSHVVIIPSHRDAVCEEYNTRICEIKSPSLVGSKSYRILISRKRILDLITTESPDIIEIGDPYRAAWIGLEAGRMRDTTFASTDTAIPGKALGKAYFLGSSRIFIPITRRSFSG